MKRGLWSQKGWALTETVLTLPILLLLLYGLLQIDQVYYHQMKLDYACFRAARSAMVRAGKEEWLSIAEKKAKKSMKNPFSLAHGKSFLDKAINIMKFISQDPKVKVTHKKEENGIEQDIQVGVPITLELEYELKLTLPLVAKWIEDSKKKGILTLKSQCSLNSEAGDYVIEN